MLSSFLQTLAMAAERSATSERFDSQQLVPAHPSTSPGPERGESKIKMEVEHSSR